ncbi:flagellar biosynthesis protein FlhF [Clostridium acidisoli DSM 12555]|uniref:Flagellar biosynthesis protein FlhF n=1 Tax=Clostridium acidisoli DSM 12555 TaxID=1121291 RepID=A0A1W1X1R6_9CLOT|nr:flagellar biosynthesis protein FlhF [Clostridium acidisoli]SMC17783.1 flagellar biosynthesis protein FlhF [Clostridium acidisoli DSM 12555]
MIIKKYVVNSMNEAMTRIRYELGNDAVIISQRKIRKKGIKGIFSKKAIEVTAAIDDKNKNNNFNNIDISDSIEAIKKAMNLEKKPLTKVIQEKNIDNGKKSNESVKNSDYLINEMKEMKNILSNIASTGISSNGKSDLHEKLEGLDLNSEIVEDIISRIRLDKREVDENEKIKEALNCVVSVTKPKNEKIIVLVGPTGVGKTTTIAKLAGRLSLIEKKKVGLITVDTYRIGAVEQLKTYADIMNIPFDVVFSIKDMEKTIENMKNCDVILVDTTGRSSKNVMQISELRAFVEKTNSKDIHLVISASTKNSDIKTIVEGYRVLNYNSLIITKLDETSTYGSLINIINYAQKPLSYVTTGQNVPDDIRCLNCDEVTNLVMGVETVC